MKATMSVMGLYEYDQTIFDRFQLPVGISKDAVVNNLCMELAELELIYPAPDMMKAAIGFWSTKQLPVWQKLFNSTMFEYDPISNYDRKEEWTENETETQNRETNGSERGNSSGTSTGSGSSINSGKDVVLNDVSAYNETTLSPRDQQTTTLGTKNDTSNQNSVSTNDSRTSNQTENTNGNRKNVRTGRAYGNIGVTTTQQMIEQERETVKFNVIDYIINEFKQRFCVLIY